MRQEKDTILNCFIEIASQDGIFCTQTLINAIAVRAKTTPQQIILLFNDGVGDIIKYFFATQNEQIQQCFVAGDSISSNIRAALHTKIEMLYENTNFAKNLYKYLFMPHKVCLLGVIVAAESNFLWGLHPVNFADFSYYTRRLSLGAIYGGIAFKIAFGCNKFEAINCCNKLLEAHLKITKFFKKSR